MAINTDHSIDHITSTIYGREIVTGLNSAFANANAAFAEANGFQAVINSAYALANSTTNLVGSAYTLANSTSNLVTGAYANANAALAEANAFQSIINSVFTLANSTTNLVGSVYTLANGHTVSITSVQNLVASAFAEANGFQSVINSSFALTNSTTNLVTGAYANANAALAEANAFQSIINSVFALTNSTTNLVASAYGRANTVDGLNSVTITSTGGLAVGGGSTATLVANGTFALTGNTATTGAVGVVQLNDVVTDASTTKAATANSVNTVWATAQAAFAKANTSSGGMENPFAGTLTVNSLTSNIGINTGFIVTNTAISIAGIDIGSGLASVYTLANGHTVSITSLQNLVAGAYNLANSDADLVAGAYALANSDANLVGGAYALANTSVQRAGDTMSGTLFLNASGTGLTVANNITFGSNVGNKLQLFGTSYGLGINSGEWAAYAAVGGRFMFRTNSISGAYTLRVGHAGDIIGLWYSGNSSSNLSGGLDRTAIGNLSPNTGVFTDLVVSTGSLSVATNIYGTTLVANTAMTINGVDIGSGLASVYTLANGHTTSITSLQNLVASAYARANVPAPLGSVTVTATSGVAVGGGSTATLVANGTFAMTANSATTAAVGVVQLTDIVTSTSATTSGTANSVNTVWATAQAAFTKANSNQNLVAGSYNLANSTSNLVVGAYANANAALAEANAFQSIINSVFTLANSTTNLVAGAYAEANGFQSIINSNFTLTNSTTNLVTSAFAKANLAVMKAGDVMSGVLTVPALTSTGGVNTGILVANSTITASGNVTGLNFTTDGIVNSQSIMVKTINVGGVYVLSQNDSGKIICLNNTTAFTINTSSVNTAAGSTGAGFAGFRVVLTQVNTGMVTVRAGPGTQLLPRITGNTSIIGQNASVSLVVWSSNVYLMDGGLASPIVTAQLNDTLTSTSTTEALTANMGNYLLAQDATNLNTTGGTISGDLQVSGNVTISGSFGYLGAQTTIGIGGIGITQAGAQKLNTQINIVTVSGAGQNSVVLPIPPVGSEIQVINRGAQAVGVFPPSGHGIDSLGLNLRANCAPNGFRHFVLANTNHWYTSSNGICTGP